MSQPIDHLQDAQREALRVERLGQRRMATQMLIGVVGGLGVSTIVSLLAYGTGLWAKRPISLLGWMPVPLGCVIVLSLARRGRLAISPLWSLSVEERHFVSASLRQREALTDPRLAAAVVEHIRVAERTFRVQACALVVFVASLALQLEDATSGPAWLTVAETAGALFVFGCAMTTYARVRRAKSAYQQAAG